MSEDAKNKPVSEKQTGGNISGQQTASISFGETKYTLKKLKAGKFYAALKVYMQMIKEIAPGAQAPGEEATVDFDKLVVSMFESWPEKMVEFIAICCSTVESETPLTKEYILEEAYPEQISEVFETCLKLNNVGANLKNFVAPIGKLGAEVQKAQPKQ